MSRQTQTIGGSILEITIRPIAHDVEGGITIGDQLGSGLPVSQLCVITIGIGKRLGISIQRGGYISASPVCALSPQRIPLFSAQRTDQYILKQMHGSPLWAERKAGLIS